LSAARNQRIRAEKKIKQIIAKLAFIKGKK
jgi:hypothetical protein